MIILPISRIKSAAVTIVAATLSLGLASVPAQAQSGPVVVQGGTVGTTTDSCAVGYVEPDRAWTAAHCGFNGQAMYNEHGVHVGTLRYVHPAGANEYDVAYIQFAHGVRAGGNPLSGDGINARPGLGERVCATGRFTGINCGDVNTKPMQKPRMFSSTPLHKKNGDSGSGVFIPGRPGVVGIYSGFSFSTIKGIQGAWSNIAEMPSPEERARLPFQGRVPNKPNINTNRELTLQEFIEHYVRAVADGAEAMSSNALSGSSFDDIKGILASYNIGYL